MYVYFGNFKRIPPIEKTLTFYYNHRKPQARQQLYTTTMRKFPADYPLRDKTQTYFSSPVNTFQTY